jgi:uncharacterized protein YhbP (UPF0306 family)
LDRSREGYSAGMRARLTLKILHILDPAGVPILPNGISPGRVRRSVFRLLTENVLCSMASITADNQAHINTAYFTYSSELKLYFLSHPNALHCQNVLRNSSVAIAIFPSNQTWGGPDRGLQLFGICRQATGREAKQAEKLYSQRFASYTTWKTNVAAEVPGHEYSFYCFVTTHMKLFDELEFGGGRFVLAKVKRSPRSR